MNESRSHDAAYLHEFGTNALIEELATRGDLALAVSAYQRRFGAPDPDMPRLEGIIREARRMVGEMKNESESYAVYRLLGDALARRPT